MRQGKEEDGSSSLPSRSFQSPWQSTSSRPLTASSPSEVISTTIVHTLPTSLDLKDSTTCPVAGQAELQSSYQGGLSHCLAVILTMADEAWTCWLNGNAEFSLSHNQSNLANMQTVEYKLPHILADTTVASRSHPFLWRHLAQCSDLSEAATKGASSNVD